MENLIIKIYIWIVKGIEIKKMVRTKEVHTLQLIKGGGDS
jgi:hypothetical protein